MPTDLITIATFMSNAEAGPARTALEAAGIRTWLQGGATADMLSHVGTALGGVKLQVAGDQYNRACEVLDAAADGDHDAPDFAWDCHLCGASIDAGFAICWSCGAEFDASASTTTADDSPGKSLDDDVERIDCPMCGASIDADSASCPSCGEKLSDAVTAMDETEEPPDHVQEAREQLRRAFRASLIGTVLCPPLLNTYSCLQLVQYEHLRREYQIEANWRLPAAYVVNGIVMLYTLAFLLLFLR